MAALTINKMCGSGLKAVMLADQAIRAGDAQIIVAGGMESMSRAPFLISGARRDGNSAISRFATRCSTTGCGARFEDMAMGAEADYIAESRGVRAPIRTPLPSKAIAGQRAACGARRDRARHRDGQDRDDRHAQMKGRGPTHRSQALAKLRPPVRQDRHRYGRQCLADQRRRRGAVVASAEKIARDSRSPIKARIVASATSGVAPKEIFIAPVSAVEKVLAKAKTDAGRHRPDRAERGLRGAVPGLHAAAGADPAKTNVHGGAIALGHPIGASGARVLVTLLYALAECADCKRGLASLCLGGGNAVAMIIERE